MELLQIKKAQEKAKNEKPDEPDEVDDRVRQVAEWDLLCRNADENNPWLKKDLIAALAQNYIHINDKTLNDDLEALNGMKQHRVAKTKAGGANAYCPISRPLEQIEYRILIDALQANAALSVKEQQRIADKLYAMMSIYQEGEMRKEISVTGLECKNKYDLVPCLQTLNEGIQEDRQVTFHYFYLDEKHNKVMQREDAMYQVEPVGLVYRNNRYYLIGWDCQKERWAHFRVDRMDRVNTTKKPNVQELPFPREKLGEYISKSLNMFSGDEVKIDLKLHDLKAIGILYDRFGSSASVRKEGDSEWTARVSVQLSPELWGWLCSKSGMITLTGPSDVRESYREWLTQALEENKK